MPNARLIRPYWFRDRYVHLLSPFLTQCLIVLLPVLEILLVLRNSYNDWQKSYFHSCTIYFAGVCSLSIAVSCGNLEILQFLLQNNKNIHKNNYCSITPLVVATLCNNIEIIKFLLSQSFRIDCKTELGGKIFLLKIHFLLL